MLSLFILPFGEMEGIVEGILLRIGPECEIDCSTLKAGKLEFLFSSRRLGILRKMLSIENRILILIEV